MVGQVPWFRGGENFSVLIYLGYFPAGPSSRQSFMMVRRGARDVEICQVAISTGGKCLCNSWTHIPLIAWGSRMISTCLSVCIILISPAGWRFFFAWFPTGLMHLSLVRFRSFGNLQSRSLVADWITHSLSVFNFNFPLVGIRMSAILRISKVTEGRIICHLSTGIFYFSTFCF